MAGGLRVLSLWEAPQSRQEPRGWLLWAFGAGPKYVRDLKNILPPIAGKVAGWVK
jgi:hypothetical protein